MVLFGRKQREQELERGGGGRRENESPVRAEGSLGSAEQSTRERATGGGGDEVRDVGASRWWRRAAAAALPPETDGTT